MCILSPTMTGYLELISFAIIFASVTSEGVSSISGISAKIDFDSPETEQETTISNVQAVLDLNLGAAPLQPESNFVQSPKNILIKNHREFARGPDVKKRRHNENRNNLNDRTTVINNIHIVVNGNETDSDDECKNNITNVSVTSRSDGEGNIITDVRFTIITNAKGSKVTVGDIPVIEGTGRQYDEPPQIYLLDRPKPVRPPVIHRHYIPQIQSNRPYHVDDRRWYNEVTYRRPQSRFYYDSGPRTWRPLPPIDDKIEPPLSRTATSDG